MSGSKRVPAKFVEDFMVVARHYMLEQHGELEQARECARNDLDNAMPCYAIMADEIRRGAV